MTKSVTAVEAMPGGRDSPASPAERLARWADTFASRAECARQSGLSPQDLNRYLRGRTEPGADVLRRMAAAGLDVNWYLVGDARATADPFLGELERVDWTPVQRDILRRNAERAAEIARELEDLARGG